MRSSAPPPRIRLPPREPNKGALKDNGMGAERDDCLSLAVAVDIATGTYSYANDQSIVTQMGDKSHSRIARDWLKIDSMEMRVPFV